MIAKFGMMAQVTEHAPGPGSPRPRRIAAPSWLDIRLVLGIALVLGSVLVGASVVASARHTSAAIAAVRSLAAGTVLAADDVRIVQVRLPAGPMYADAVSDVVGKRLS